ncbi:hypothetical protein [Actinopolyspora erythraea]|nr:hypothetical protein [Actinopolyspora erythraea]
MSTEKHYRTDGPTESACGREHVSPGEGAGPERRRTARLARRCAEANRRRQAWLLGRDPS